MDKRLLTLAVCFVGSLSFAQENRRAPWFQPVRAASGGGGGSVYNDLIVNDLANVSTASDQTSYETPSYRPAPDALVLVTVINSKASAPDIPTFSGNGLTWVQIGTSNFNTLAVPTQRITMFRGQGASPTPGPGIADFGGATQTGCIIQVVEFQGADATAANGANAIVQTNYNGADTTANPSIAYTTPSLPGTNAMFWAYGDSANSATDSTPNTNWVELRELNYATPATGGSFDYQMNALGATSTTNIATSRNWAGMCIEVKPGLDPDALTRPTLVQHLATFDGNEAGQYYTNWLPNPTLPGNMLLVHVVHTGSSRPNGQSTVQDDKGSIYTQIFAMTNHGVVFEDFIATNIVAGINYVNVNESQPSAHIHMEFTEFAHVLAYNPLDTSNFAAPNPPLLDFGSINTGADGDLIVNYGVCVNNSSITFGTPANQYYHGGGRFLSTQRNVNAFANHQVQAKAGNLHSLVYSVETPGDIYASECLAFKRGSSGTLPSSSAIRIIRVQQNIFGADTPFLLLPFEGGLTHWSDTWWKDTPANTDASTVSNPSASWTIIKTVNSDAPQMGYASNCPPCVGPPMVMTMTTSHGDELLYAYDIANASVYPFDTQQEASGDTSPTSNALVTNAPSIIPSTSNGLIIAENCYGIGPASTSVTASQILDSIWYPGAGDVNLLNAGTANQHYFNPDTSTVNFGQQLANGTTTSWAALAVAYKAK